MSNYYNRVETDKNFYLIKENLYKVKEKTLFKGAKVYLHNSVTFSRNKLDNYELKRVIDYKKADFVIVDSVKIRDLCRYGSRYKKTDSGFKYDFLRDNTPVEHQYVRLQNTQSSLFNDLELLKSENLTEIIDLIKFTNEDKQVMTFENYETICKYIITNDQTNMAIGLEMMTNYNVQESIVFISAILSNHGYDINRSSYAKCNSYRSFITEVSKIEKTNKSNVHRLEHDFRFINEHNKEFLYNKIDTFISDTFSVDLSKYKITIDEI